MPKSSFTTHPVSLEYLLRSCAEGKMQLPDFQRSWVWDEERIRSLIASISRSFPVGALMTLASRPGTNDTFARRAIEGAPPEASLATPEKLLLDGQQRMTSLYHACMRKEVVKTITPKKKLVKRWFYIDIAKSLKSDADREDSILIIPEDRRIKANFDKDIILDLSTSKGEYEKMLFPLNCVFDYDTWQYEFADYWIEKGQLDRRKVFREFKERVLDNFEHYQVPEILLDHTTSNEAVCLVFEKVNTGGKPLDAFELLTAMYAAGGHKLRDDWLGTPTTTGLQIRLKTFGHAAEQKVGVLEKVASTDVLQAIALLHTKAVRDDQVAKGVKENDLSAIRATRQSLLDLPLPAYLQYREAVENGFKQVAKFLRSQQIHREFDLPYQGQLVPFAAIYAELGDPQPSAAVTTKLTRWYWCGVFGELYGSAIESRFAKDIVEVPLWLKGGPEPSTVKEGLFHADRLLTMYTRQSAAYKGIHAMLMCEGAKDFRTGQNYKDTVFFDEGVDIHHIFPEAWCISKKISRAIYNSIINKTPLSYQTNRKIGGVAPSEYLKKLEAGRKGEPSIPRDMLDEHLRSHCVAPELMWADDFEGFMAARRKSLMLLISKATGHVIAEGPTSADEGEELSDELARDLNPVETSE